MSANYPSSNPFRRKAPPASAPSEHPSILSHIAYQQAKPLADNTNLQRVDAPKKATKKVRVQSPPPPSPSIPDSSSTIGEDAFSIPAKPPTPIPRDEDDPFDSTSSDISEDEAVIRPMQAPANPFQKTLETMEHPERDTPVKPPTNVASPGRASLDVEAFKRLLMTGNAGLGISTPPTASQTHLHHALGDGGSSTDTSSISRQSIFEPIQEAHPESPRTSHEISEPEDDGRGLTAESSTSGRKKPPPPSSRHGKLIKMELREDPSTPTTALASPPTPSSNISQQFFTSSPLNRSQTDLNKPLPPAPTRASHESDRESIFDKEAAGKTPEPPSPSASLRRKTPPAPPITRRHSQLVSDSKLTRSDIGRLSPKAEEGDTPSTISSLSGTESGRPRSASARAPPPPPSRRPPSVRGFSHQLPLTSPSSMSLPPIPPVRGSSKSGRPPSVMSLDLSSPSSTPWLATNKRASTMAPPPPPHKHGRNSMEGQSPSASTRTSWELGRRSMDSGRRGSETSSLSRLERIESPEGDLSGNELGGRDVLADLTKLQREIDALRVKSENEKGS